MRMQIDKTDCGKIKINESQWVHLCYAYNDYCGRVRYC